MVRWKDDYLGRDRKWKLNYWREGNGWRNRLYGLKVNREEGRKRGWRI